jgi:hypothetical protein
VITGDRRDLGMSIHEFEHGYPVRPFGLLGDCDLESSFPHDKISTSFRQKIACHQARLSEMQQIAHAHLLYARFHRLVKLNSTKVDLPVFKEGEQVLVYAPPSAADAKLNPNLGKHLIRFRRGYVVKRRLVDASTHRLRDHYELTPPKDSIYAGCPSIFRHASLMRPDKSTPDSLNRKRHLNDPSPPFKEGEFITFSNPDDTNEFHLGKILSESSQDDSRILTAHVFGSRSATSLSTASFRPVFWDESKRDSDPIQLGTPRTRQLKALCVPFTVEISPEVVLLRHLDFKDLRGRLSPSSIARILDLTEMPHWF